MLKYWEENELKEKEKYGSIKKELINADLVFGKFIFEMNKRVNSTCINFLIRLIIYLRKGICREKKNPNYCLECTASLIPNTFN